MLTSSSNFGQVTRLNFLLMLNKLLILVLIFLSPATLFGQNIYLQLNKCWDLNREEILFNKIASDNKSLFIPLNNALLSYDKNFQLTWTIETGNFEPSKIHLNDNEIILVTNYIEDYEQNREQLQNKLYKVFSISKETGLINWQKDLLISKEYKIINSYLINQKLILTINNSDLLTLNLKDKSIENTSKSNNIPIVNSYSFEDSFYLINTEKKLIKYNFSNKIKEYLLTSEFEDKIIFANDKNLLFANNKGEISNYDLTKRKSIWTTRIGAEISSITKYNDYFLISSLDNYLYFLSYKNGEFKWRKRFEGRIIGELYQSKSIYISLILNSNQGFILEPNTGKIIDQIILNEDQYFIGKPIFIEEHIILPYNKGIFIFKMGQC